MSKDIRKYFWIEFLVWVFILLFVAVGIRTYRHLENKKLVTYQIFIPDVDGLIVGSPVRFLGVQIGYISKVKILSNEVYLKFVVSDKNITLPKGAIATVEFNGLGGSKSLEIYPPNQESINSGKIVEIKRPTRLSDATALLSDMYNKIDSIIVKVSNFANATGTLDIKKGIDMDAIENNINSANIIMKKIKE